MEGHNQLHFVHDYDPVLVNDFSQQQQTSNTQPQSNSGDSYKLLPYEQTSVMEYLDSPSEGQIKADISLTSPDLVICLESPDIPQRHYGDSSEYLADKFHQKMECSVELSLENGFNKSESKQVRRTPSVRFSTLCQTYAEELSPEASFELCPLPKAEDEAQKHLLSVKVINSGSNYGASAVSGPIALNDNGFINGVSSTGLSQIAQCQTSKDICEFEPEGDNETLLIDHLSLKRELMEMRGLMEELKKDNLVKSRECKEAKRDLRELQNELMRKSMHVGSLAFAIEGQVKEKTRWFSALRDLTRKLKIMKIEHTKMVEEALAYKTFQADMNLTTSTINSTLNHQVHMHDDLKKRFISGARERKELYNKVLELKGNIRVFCRCRPLNYEEIAAGTSAVIDFESAKDGELGLRSNGAIKRTFKFDAVFGPQTDQAEVFEDTAPFATSVLDGYNVCVFAYGQTGTGKTFTMVGTEEARGVNFRTLDELFRIIREREKMYRYSLSVSVMEVYNEQIRDLLGSATQPGGVAKRLEVRQVGEGVHHVPGLVEAQVSTMTEVWEVLQTGSNARAIGSTNANEHSSRSHCIHCVMVKGENILTGECTRSKLWLVDLAGSERVAKSEVQGERLKETQNINRSLSALGDVISALATKSPHIPFRNSKLTHLLQDSLGGDSKTLMFVQISPNESDLSETLCSLNFASRVRGIELGTAKKQPDNSELLRYKQMAEKAKLDIKSKEVQIKKMEETVYGLELKIKEKDLKNKNLQDKVKELESQLLVERKLARQHVDTKIAEQQIKHQQEEQIMAPMRQPLGGRTLGSHKNVTLEPAITLSKDQTNPIQPLMEKNNYRPSLAFYPMEDAFAKNIDLAEKENNPDMVEKSSYLPKRTGRASISTMARQNPATPASRRNSLIPVPNVATTTTTTNTAQLPVSLLSLTPKFAENKENSDGSLSSLAEQTSCESPKKVRSGGRKINNIARKSTLRRIQAKSPLQRHLKKGLNVGMDKLRVSIGSRGKMGQRVLLSNARRPGAKVMLDHNQKEKEKERGWNIGGIGRIN